MSAITQIPFIPEGSQATPGLFNSRYQIANENFSSLGSGFFMSELSNVTIGGFIHATIGVGIGSLPSGSTQTTAALIIGVNSNHSDYFHLTDSSGQRSSYIIGSRVGGTADGLNIYDQSGQTMIVSFSKQSVRFFQQIVGPVFDTASDFVNAATLGSGSDSTESRIDAAIIQAAQGAKTGVYLPRAFYPYSASSVSFIHTLRMVREGGDVSTYDVLAYGAHGNGSHNDRSAFSGAVAACPAGGTVVVSQTSNHYRIDNSNGFPDAIVLNKRMTLRVEGEVRSTYGALQVNPPTIFSVTTDDVTLEGNGTIRGDGTKNDTNAGDDTTMPSLVRVTGKRFVMNGLTINTPPKIGIHLDGANCEHARIVNCKFTGGPAIYNDTAYFAIRGNQGGQHVIANNHFYPDADGGMYVSCIFFNNTNQCVIEANVATKPFEKLTYIAGSFNLITNNFVVGSTTTIPGTTQTGTVGPVYRADGTYNKIQGNYSRFGGGAQSIGGQGTDVSGNMFLNCGQSAIAISSGAIGLDHINIVNNVATCGNLPGVALSHGILVESTSTLTTSSYVNISHNQVTGFAPSNLLVNVPSWQTSTFYGRWAVIQPMTPNGFYYTPVASAGTTAASQPTFPASSGSTVADGTLIWMAVTPGSNDKAQIQLSGAGTGQEAVRCTIQGNSMGSGQRGITTNYMMKSSVFGNQIQAVQYGIVESNGSANRYRQNLIEGAANPGISGLNTATCVTDTPIDWTPVIKDGAGASMTMGGSSSNAAVMTRVGRRVLMTGNVATTSIGTTSGAIKITGLPVAAATGIGNRASLLVGYGAGFALTAGYDVNGFLDSGTSAIELYVWDTAAGVTAMTAAEWSDDGNMAFSIEYNAADE